MRLTQYTDFGLRLLIYLASTPERSASVREVAEAYGISKSHLNKTALELTAKGVLVSRRGRGGGVGLARSPHRISIGGIVRMLEPDFNLVECMRPGNACAITPVCGFRGVCQEAQAALLAVFDRYTLADVIVNESRCGEVCRLLEIPLPAP